MLRQPLERELSWHSAFTEQNWAVGGRNELLEIGCDVSCTWIVADGTTEAPESPRLSGADLSRPPPFYHASR